MTFLNITDSTPGSTTYPYASVEAKAFRDAFEVLRIQRSKGSPGLIKINVYNYSCISYVTALSSNSKPNDWYYYFRFSVLYFNRHYECQVSYASSSGGGVQFFKY